MDSYYLLLLFGLTSLLVVGSGARILRLRARSLPAALSRMLECAGLAVVLVVVNVAAGFLLVLALRSLTGTFVSLYLNTDTMIVVMSVLQAMALQWWMEGGEEG